MEDHESLRGAAEPFNRPADADSGMTPRRVPVPGRGAARRNGPRLHADAVAARPVFVAPQRASRPHDAHGAPEGSGAGPPSVCPFCAGNEACTPASVLAFPEAGSAWRARIVPNVFPIVVEAPREAGMPDRCTVRPAHGVHEVVIEAAAHDRSILAIDPADWREVWELGRRRLAMLAARDDLAWATLFKNSGPRAGASLEHVHSQLVALDFVPPIIAAEMSAVSAAADPFGRLVAEAAAAGRIVAECHDLVALVPPAPRQPFETWILPRDPEPHFHATGAARVTAVADLTRFVVARLDASLPGTDYNWWLHQLPFRGHDAAGRWHWHLEIVPRIAELAGFELGTGCHVTTMPPEESARMLRAHEV